MSAFVFYGTQRDPQYKLLLYGQKEPTTESLDWTIGFEGVLWVNFDHFFLLNMVTLRNPPFTAMEANA